jgi:hypothetical protein
MMYNTRVYCFFLISPLSAILKNTTPTMLVPLEYRTVDRVQNLNNPECWSLSVGRQYALNR